MYLPRISECFFLRWKQNICWKLTSERGVSCKLSLIKFAMWCYATGVSIFRNEYALRMFKPLYVGKSVFLYEIINVLALFPNAMVISKSKSHSSLIASFHVGIKPVNIVCIEFYFKLCTLQMWPLIDLLTTLPLMLVLLFKYYFL